MGELFQTGCYESFAEYHRRYVDAAPIEGLQATIQYTAARLRSIAKAPHHQLHRNFEPSLKTEKIVTSLAIASLVIHKRHFT